MDWKDHGSLAARAVAVASRCKLSVVAALSCCLIACGGGGDASGSATSSPASPGGSASSPSSGVFGTAVALRLANDLADRQGRATNVQAQVLAVDAAGITRDVTDQVTTRVNDSDRLTVTHAAGGLNLAFSKRTGPVMMHLDALGLSLDKSFWITQVPTADVSSLRVIVADGFAPVVANKDGSYSFLPGRAIRLNARVTVPGFGEQDVTAEVDFTSSSEATAALQPSFSEAGEVTWINAFTSRPGDSEVTLQWLGSRRLSKVLRVASGLLLQAGWAQQDALTENAGGRLTAYVHGAATLGQQQNAYVESIANNAWGPLVFLNAPPSVISSLAKARAAESSNGYRAVVATNTLGDAWIHLIGPNGELRGPIVLNSGWASSSDVLQVAVTPNGNGHVWIFDRARLTVFRFELRFADGVLTAPNALVLPSTGNLSLQVSVAASGTVGIAWADVNCGVHFAFDDLLTPVSGSPTDVSVLVSECRPFFSQVFTSFTMAAASNEMGLIIRYGTEYNAVTTELLSVKRGGGATVTLLDHDTPATTGSPQIGATDAGELVAIWATSDRGMWGVHRAASGSASAPFLVHAQNFSLATPKVEGVLSRGDGRFVLVWQGGSIGIDTPLEMSNFSASAGLSDMLLFPYQNSLATNSTSLIATPYGISSLWSFFVGTGDSEVDAIQRFLP